MNTWNTDFPHRNHGINTSSQVSTQNSNNNNKNQCAEFRNCTTLENLLTTRFLPEKVLRVLVGILRTLILSILCIPKMISTFSLPFYYRGRGRGRGVGWGVSFNNLSCLHSFLEYSYPPVGRSAALWKPGGQRRSHHLTKSVCVF